jgi:hypothetical protein
VNFGESVTYDVMPLAMGSSVTGGLGAAKADSLGELLGAVYPDFSQTLANDQYAALQIAIWEITRENVASFGYDVATGDVQFSGSNATILGLANTYLAQVDGIGERARGIRALVNERRQDMLVQFPVPEPGSLALALMGLGAVYGTRRRQSAR